MATRELTIGVKVEDKGGSDIFNRYASAADKVAASAGKMRESLAMAGGSDLASKFRSRMDTIMDELNTTATRRGQRSEAIERMLGLAGSDDTVAKVRSKFQDTFDKIGKQIPKVQMGGDPAPLLNSLRSVHQQALALKGAAEQSSVAMTAGFSRAAGGAEQLARGVMLVGAGDKDLERIAQQLARLQGFSDVARGLYSLATGIGGAIGNYSRLREAMAAARETGVSLNSVQALLEASAGKTATTATAAAAAQGRLSVATTALAGADSKELLPATTAANTALERHIAIADAAAAADLRLANASKAAANGQASIAMGGNAPPAGTPPVTPSGWAKYGPKAGPIIAGATLLPMAANAMGYSWGNPLADMASGAAVTYGGQLAYQGAGAVAAKIGGAGLVGKGLAAAGSIAAGSAMTIGGGAVAGTVIVDEIIGAITGKGPAIRNAISTWWDYTWGDTAKKMERMQNARTQRQEMFARSVALDEQRGQDFAIGAKGRDAQFNADSMRAQLYEEANYPAATRALADRFTKEGTSRLDSSLMRQRSVMGDLLSSPSERTAFEGVRAQAGELAQANAEKRAQAELAVTRALNEQDRAIANQARIEQEMASYQQSKERSIALEMQLNERMRSATESRVSAERSIIAAKQQQAQVTRETAEAESKFHKSRIDSIQQAIDREKERYNSAKSAFGLMDPAKQQELVRVSDKIKRGAHLTEGEISVAQSHDLLRKQTEDYGSRLADQNPLFKQFTENTGINERIGQYQQAQAQAIQAQAMVNLANNFTINVDAESLAGQAAQAAYAAVKDLKQQITEGVRLEFAKREQQQRMDNSQMLNQQRANTGRN